MKTNKTHTSSHWPLCIPDASLDIQAWFDSVLLGMHHMHSSSWWHEKTNTTMQGSQTDSVSVKVEGICDSFALICLPVFYNLFMPHLSRHTHHPLSCKYFFWLPKQKLFTEPSNNEMVIVGRICKLFLSVNSATNVLTCRVVSATMAVTMKSAILAFFVKCMVLA